MRKVLLTMIMVFSSLIASAQEIVFYTPSGYKTQYAIYMLNLKNGKDKYSIDAYSYDKLVKDATIFVDEDNIHAFFQSIQMLKEKFVEWVDTAKANNVKELYKEVPVECPIVSTSFKFGNEFHFSFNKKTKANFFIFKENYYSISLETGKCVSSKNEYITHDGMGIIFNDAKDFDNLIAAIKSLKIEKSQEVEVKQKVNDLFK